MTFKELLNSVTFDEVAPCLLQMHPDAEGNLKWYKIHFDMLRLMTPKHHDDANSDVCHISMSEWDEDSEPEDFESLEDWNKTIQKMIDAFELVKDNSPSYEEDIRTVDQGVELLCKYYRELSD